MPPRPDLGHVPGMEMPAAPRSRPLTVYMPLIHAALMAGIAASFADAGVAMKVSGPTMTLRQGRERRMASAEAAATYGAHVSAYEGDEILADPPDVILVGNVANEPASLELARAIRARGPVVLCAYSGRVQSAYRWRRYDGIVANDSATRAIARHHGVPALKFYPGFDIAAYPFRPEPAQETVVLRSFINDFETRFPLAAAFFAECRDVLARRFGARVTAENVSRQNRGAVRRLMVGSTALLHLKDSEGYGYSVLEGMACGRPIITQSGLARGMAYNDWAVVGRSQFRLERPDDIVPLVERMFDDPAWRAGIQRAAGEDMRALDLNGHAFALRRFFEALALLARLRHAPPHRRGEEPIAPFAPTLDPAALQPFERVALAGRRVDDVEWFD